MKTTLLILALSLGFMSGYAQNRPICKRDPQMPANAKPAFPKSDYIPLQDPACPPCYTYRNKRGLKIMECHYLRFPAQKETIGQTSGNLNINRQTTASVSRQTTDNDNLEVRGQNVYAGNYPPVCKRDPQMPANAVPAWPKSDYTPLQDPRCAPCYKYRNKRGLTIMECHELRFPAEHEDIR